MSYNPDDFNIEVDDLMIQSRLNESLELEGIRVSEDLIHRTLTAIQNQGVEKNIIDRNHDNTKVKVDDIEANDIIETDNGEQSKIKPGIVRWNRYVLRLALITAASVVVIVGSQMMESMNLYKAKEDQKTVTNDSSLKRTDQGFNERSTIESKMETENESTKQNMNSMESGEDSSDDAGFNTSDSLSAYSFNHSGEVTTALSGEFLLTFADMNPIPSEGTESIDITDETTENSLFLSSPQDIKEFYSILEHYTFMDGSKSFGSEHFSIRINGQGASFTLIIEENYVVTSYVYGDEKIDGRYIANDHSSLFTDIQTFYLKYNP